MLGQCQPAAEIEFGHLADSGWRKTLVKYGINQPRNNARPSVTLRMAERLGFFGFLLHKSMHGRVERCRKKEL